MVVLTTLESPLTTSILSISTPINGKRLSTLIMLPSQEEDTLSSLLVERSIVMVDGTQRVNTTTLSSLIWILLNGTTQIFTTIFQDGIIAPLWLKLFHHGNILFSVVRLVISQKEVPETSVIVLTVLVTLILRPCIGPLFNQKMLMVQTKVFYHHLENTQLWPMTTKIQDY